MNDDFSDGLVIGYTLGMNGKKKSGGGGGEDEGWKYPDFFPEVPDPDDHEITMLLEITQNDINKPSIILYNNTSVPTGEDYKNVKIDWGDGLISEWSEYYTISITHYYSEPGFYIVRFTSPPTAINNGIGKTASTVYISGKGIPDLDVENHSPIVERMNANNSLLRVLKIGSRAFLFNTYAALQPTNLVYLKYFGSFEYRSDDDIQRGRANMLNNGVSNCVALQKFETEFPIHSYFDDNNLSFYMINTKLKDLDFLRTCPHRKNMV